MMRVKLKSGKQRELILKAKNNSPWKKLADRLNINEKYLYHELKNEMRILDEKLYKKLCNLTLENFDVYIEKRLNDNWGQSLGGKNSRGSIKELPEIKFNENLAEFVGAVLGDGHVEYNKKRGVYHIRISGDLVKDKEYHRDYLKNIVEKIFNLKAVEQERPKNNGRFLDIYSKNLVKFFISMGINPGNKIKNQSTIPNWIKKDNEYIRACIRGLIDTDGSLFRMSKKDPYLLRITFTNYNSKLLNDTRNIFIKLGFHPSKVILDKQFFISRKEDISKYLKEIGFSNNKHLERLNQFTSPVV